MSKNTKYYPKDNAYLIKKAPAMRDLLFTSYLFFYNSFIQNLVFRMLALELRNNLLHPLHDLHIPLHGTSMYQGINPQIGVRIIIRTDLGDLDLRMKVGLEVSSSLSTSSYNFSPSRNPVNRISIPFTPLRRSYAQPDPRSVQVYPYRTRRSHPHYPSYRPLGPAYKPPVST